MPLTSYVGQQMFMVLRTVAYVGAHGWAHMCKAAASWMYKYYNMQLVSMIHVLYIMWSKHMMYLVCLPPADGVKNRHRNMSEMNDWNVNLF